MKTPKIPSPRLRAVAASWAATGMVLAGGAWLLGLERSWWQRALMVLPMLVLAVLDARGITAVTTIRISGADAIAALGWLQLPLAVAGGAWLLGFDAPLATRSALAGLVCLVAGLYRYALTTPPVTGGAR